MSVSDVRSQGRILELDSLRGIGAIAVLAFHLWPKSFSFAGTRVDLFFVISGYLISRLLLRSEFSLGFLAAFWTRRLLRTWPTYYILIFYLYEYNNYGNFFHGENALWRYLLFCQNLGHYWSTSVPSLHLAVLHTWSLAIEEQFYFLFPMFFLFFGKKHLLLFSIVLLINSVIARSAGLNSYVLLARCDGLSLGAILAVLNQKSITPFHRKGATLFICSLGLCLMVTAYHQMDTPYPTNGRTAADSLAILGVSCFYYGVVDLVINHHGQPFLKFARFRPLVYLGQISYGIYLYHALIIIEIERFHYGKSAWTDALAIVTTILVSIFSWEVLERNTAKLKSLVPYPRISENVPQTSI